MKRGFTEKHGLEVTQSRNGDSGAECHTPFVYLRNNVKLTNPPEPSTAGAPLLSGGEYGPLPANKRTPNENDARNCSFIIRGCGHALLSSGGEFEGLFPILKSKSSRTVRKGGHAGDVPPGPLSKGFTTNPTLMRKGRNSKLQRVRPGYPAHNLGSSDLVPKCFPMKFSELESQAKVIAAWGKERLVKIPHHQHTRRRQL
jgi:hypothetical protein